MYFRTSGYGIIDKRLNNVDIKLVLVEAGENRNIKSGLDITVDGQRINGSRKKESGIRLTERRSISGVSKEDLAAKPLKYVLGKNQWHLSIGFDLEAGHLTMKLEGTDAARLPPFWKSKEIIF